MSRKHRRSKATLTKQVATKRDVQRARDEILHALVHAASWTAAEPVRLHVAPVERVEADG